MKAVELQRCARAALEKCACVKAGERVLVVTDTMRDQSVAQALMGAALAANAEAVLTVIPTRRSTPQEPPAASTLESGDRIGYLYCRSGLIGPSSIPYLRRVSP